MKIERKRTIPIVQEYGYEDDDGDEGDQSSHSMSSAEAVIRYLDYRSQARERKKELETLREQCIAHSRASLLSLAAAPKDSGSTADEFFRRQRALFDQEKKLRKEANDHNRGILNDDEHYYPADAGGEQLRQQQQQQQQFSLFDNDVPPQYPPISEKKQQQQQTQQTRKMQSMALIDRYLAAKQSIMKRTELFWRVTEATTATTTTTASATSPQESSDHTAQANQYHDGGQPIFPLLDAVGACSKRWEEQDEEDSMKEIDLMDSPSDEGTVVDNAKGTTIPLLSVKNQKVALPVLWFSLMAMCSSNILGLVLSLALLNYNLRLDKIKPQELTSLLADGKFFALCRTILHQVQATASDNEQEDTGEMPDEKTDTSRSSQRTNLVDTVGEALKADSNQLMADTVRKFQEALRTIHETNESSEQDDSNRSHQFMTIQRQESVMEEIPYIATMLTMPSFGHEENIHEDMEEDGPTMTGRDVEESHEFDIEPLESIMDANPTRTGAATDTKKFDIEKGYCEHSPEEEGPEILVRDDNKKLEADGDAPTLEKRTIETNVEAAHARDSLRRLKPLLLNHEDENVNESRDVADERVVDCPAMFELGYETDRESPPIAEASVLSPDNRDRVVRPISEAMHSLFQLDSSDEGELSESDDDAVHLNELDEVSSMVYPGTDVDIAKDSVNDAVPEGHVGTSALEDSKLSIAEQAVTSALGCAVLSDDHSMISQSPPEEPITEKPKEVTVDETPLRPFDVVIPDGFGLAEVELLLDGAVSCAAVDNQSTANTAMIEEIQENAVNLVNKASRMAAEVLSWIESEGRNQLDFEEIQKDASKAATANGIVVETINYREIGQIALFEPEQESLDPEPRTRETFEQERTTGSMVGNTFVEETLQEACSNAQEESSTAVDDTEKEIQCLEIGIKSDTDSVQIEVKPGVEEINTQLDVENSTKEVGEEDQIVSDQENETKANDVDLLPVEDKSQCVENEETRPESATKADSEILGIETGVDMNGDFPEAEVERSGNFYEQRCLWFEHEEIALEVKADTENVGIEVQVEAGDEESKQLYAIATCQADVSSDGLEGETKAEGLAREQLHCEEENTDLEEKSPVEHHETERNLLDSAPAPETNESFGLVHDVITPEAEDMLYPGDVASRTDGLEGELNAEEVVHEQLHCEERRTIALVMLSAGEVVGAENNTDVEENFSLELFGLETNLPVPESSETIGLPDNAMKPASEDTLYQGGERDRTEKLSVAATEDLTVEIETNGEMEEDANATLDGGMIHSKDEIVSQVSQEAVLEADADGGGMKKNKESDNAQKQARAIKAGEDQHLQKAVETEEADIAKLEVQTQAIVNNSREDEQHQEEEVLLKKSEELSKDKLEAQEEGKVIKAREQERQEMEARLKSAEEADKARLEAQKLARIASMEAARFKREKAIEEKARLKAEAEREQAREETRRAEAACMRAEEETARLKVKIEERMAEEIEVQMTVTAHNESEPVARDDEASLARINAAVVLRKVHEAEERRKTHEAPSVNSAKNSRLTTKLSSTRSVTSRASKQSEVGSKFPSNIPRFSSTSSCGPKEVLKPSSSYQSEFFSCGGSPGSVSSEDYLTVYMRSSDGGEEGTIDLSDLSKDEEYDLATMGSFSTQWSSGTRKYIFESTPAFAKHAKALHDQRHKAKLEAGDEDDSTGYQGSLNRRYWSTTCYTVGAIAIMGLGGTIALSPKYREKIASFDPMTIVNLAKASWASAWYQIHPEQILRYTMASLSSVRDRIHADQVVSYAKATLTLVSDKIQPAIIKKFLVEKSLALFRDNLRIESIVDCFMKAKNMMQKSSL